MKHLNKIKLNFQNSILFLKENLDNANTLSTGILNLINFKKGCFFTLLPCDANIDAIHSFQAGWILPPNPIQEYWIDGKKATYSVKKSIRDEMVPLIFKEIASHSYLCCIFDDILASSKDEYYSLCPDDFSFFYKEEVYYCIKKNNTSLEIIGKCLKDSFFSFWHSLIVFTTADMSDITKTLTLEKIQEICLKTELVMVGAYDGEGYVFWEKNGANENRGFFGEIACKL